METTMPAKKSSKKSIQNKQLTHEEIMGTLAEMEDFMSKVRKHDAAIIEAENRFEHFAKNDQERRKIRASIEELTALKRKAQRNRFELFLKLIVRVRNQSTKKGSYTKANFLSEVSQYQEFLRDM
jgi:D-mannonate dehydratase